MFRDNQHTKSTHPDKQISFLKVTSQTKVLQAL